MRHKQYRVFKRRGETKMMISKTSEPVYYHPLRSCAPSASSLNIKLEETVVTRLSDSNKQFFVAWIRCSIQLKEGRFFFAFLRQNLHTFLFLNFIQIFEMFQHFLHFFPRKSWRNHEHWSNKHCVWSFITLLTYKFCGYCERSFDHFMTHFVN